MDWVAPEVVALFRFLRAWALRQNEGVHCFCIGYGRRDYSLWTGMRGRIIVQTEEIY